MAREGATAPRRAALEVLRAVRSGDLADRALDRQLATLPVRERAWTQELVYGTLRLRGRIDHVLNDLVRGGTAALEPDVLDVLRLGLYQLTEMGSVPAYAAVSQSVELARSAGVGRAARLVNGVLQNAARRGADVRFPAADVDPAGHLETWGSHPRWLVDRWIRLWGPADAGALVELNNQRPELFVTVVGLETEEALERLRAAGIRAAPVDVVPGSIRIESDTTAADVLATVPAVVQDPAAAAVARFADVPERSTLIDLCAAPGGKAIVLSARAGLVVAGDVSPGRLRRIRENAARLGLEDRVLPVAADARHAPYRPADVVLLDAPCTGTGTLRRHPDGRWRIRPQDLEALVALQHELLEAAAELVLPGGLLVYSTCSLEPEENEHQVRGFLDRHPEFILEPPERAVDPGLRTREGFLSVLPQRHGVDGSFAARIRRQA